MWAATSVYWRNEIDSQSLIADCKPDERLTQIAGTDRDHETFSLLRSLLSRTDVPIPTNAIFFYLGQAKPLTTRVEQSCANVSTAPQKDRSDTFHTVRSRNGCLTGWLLPVA
jgi:hypothetical protein